MCHFHHRVREGGRGSSGCNPISTLLDQVVVVVAAIVVVVVLVVVENGLLLL